MLLLKLLGGGLAVGVGLAAVDILVDLLHAAGAGEVGCPRGAPAPALRLTVFGGER